MCWHFFMLIEVTKLGHHTKLSPYLPLRTQSSTSRKKSETLRISDIIMVQPLYKYRLKPTDTRKVNSDLFCLVLRICLRLQARLNQNGLLRLWFLSSRRWWWVWTRFSPTAWRRSHLCCMPLGVKRTRTDHLWSQVLQTMPCKVSPKVSV